MRKIRKCLPARNVFPVGKQLITFKPKNCQNKTTELASANRTKNNYCNKHLRFKSNLSTITVIFLLPRRKNSALKFDCRAI